jgi:alpha-tubulin suppressor-like RCC1 family protein
VAATRQFVEVSAGLLHVCALDTAGAVYCWGTNTFGQLGDSTLTTSLVPIPVLGGRRFNTVSVGNFFSCGLSTQGRAYCWGSNISFEQGNGGNDIAPVLIPTPIASADIFTSLSSGGFHSCAVRMDEELMCWGANTYGKLGNGTVTATVVPTVVGGGFQFSATGAGGNHTCGVTRDDGLYCWGSNVLGQLGSGLTDNSKDPKGVFGYSSESPGT